MYKYQIEGGHPLRGRIRPSGNKNAALPCLAAAPPEAAENAGRAPQFCPTGMVR